MNQSKLQELDEVDAKRGKTCEQVMIGMFWFYFWLDEKIAPVFKDVRAQKVPSQIFF